MTQVFNIGDIVTKTYGKKPAKITYVYSGGYSYGGQYSCKYLHSGGSFNAYGNDLKIYEEETEMTTDTKTLYSFTIDGETRCRYGTHIGTNSQNQYLIEEKGTGAIHVLDKSALEEVVPYTFSASINGNETHYIGTPDVLKKGDVLLYTGSTTPQVAVVTGVDTKNKGARSKFKGAKIVTETI
jgi:hypothetical protein